MAKEVKTNAMRFLDRSGVKYEFSTYSCGEFIDGVTTAETLGQPVEETFKTLIAQGKTGAYYCFLIPVALELDHVKDITKVTGYVRGGCTPIGMKKQFVTVIHSSAEELPLFYISGGRIGLQLHLSPEDLAGTIGAKFCDIVME